MKAIFAEKILLRAIKLAQVNLIFFLWFFWVKDSKKCFYEKKKLHQIFYICVIGVSDLNIHLTFTKKHNFTFPKQHTLKKLKPKTIENYTNKQQ